MSDRHGLFETNDVPSNMSGNFSANELQRQQGVFSPPVEKPKRPLSAFNFFFRSERGRLLAEKRPGADSQPRNSPCHHLSFRETAMIIGRRWHEMDYESKAYFEDLAQEDKDRYKDAMAEYRRRVREWQEQQERVDTSNVESASNQSGSSTANETTIDQNIARISSRLDPDMVNLLIAAFK